MSNWDPDVVSLLGRTFSRDHRFVRRGAPVGDRMTAPLISTGRMITPNSTFLIPIEGDAKKRLIELQAKIPSGMLASNTPDPTKPCISVRWGQETPSVAVVRTALKDFGPIHCTFGLVGMKYIKGSSCIVHHIASPKLEGLRELLYDGFYGAIENDWFPHVVVAKVHPASALMAVTTVGGKRGSATHRMSSLIGVSFEAKGGCIRYWNTENDVPVDFGKHPTLFISWEELNEGRPT